MPECCLTPRSLVLQITIKRHEVNETELYPQLVRHICMIDIVVALCGCGTGGFVKAMLQHGLFPIDTRFIISATSSTAPNDENEYVSLVVTFNGEIAVMAAKLGLVAQNLRREADQQTYADEPSLARTQRRRSRRRQQILAIQQNLRWKWNQMPPGIIMGVRNGTLPAKVQGYYDHVSGWIRCCSAA